MSKPTYEELEQRISALEQTEIRLKNTEKTTQQYKRAVETSLDLMVELDRDYTYQFANKGYLKYHQLKEEEIIGHHFGEVLGEDYFKTNLKSYLDRCLDGETVQFETVYDYRGKGKCYMEVWYFPRIEEDGKIKGVVSLARDITERKKAERALKDSEEQYRSLILRIQAAVVVHGADTQVIASNPKAQELLGLTEKQMLGKTVTDKAWKFHRSDGEKMSLEEYPVNRVMATKQSLRDLTTGVCHPEKDDMAWVLVNADPVLDDEGGIQQVIVTFMDITERKRAEEALRESEEQFRLLIQRIQTAIVVHGADTQIIASNPKTYELLGLSKDQMLGKTVIDNAWKFLDADGKEMPLEEYPVNRVLATQQPLRDYTVGVCRSDKNNLAWVLVNANPVFDDKHNIQQVIVTFMDITERKRTEEALQENERLLNKVGDIAKIGGWEMNLEKGGEATWTKGTFDIVEINPEEPIPGLNEHVSWYLMEYREMIEKKMRDLIEKKQPMQFEAMLRTRKGNLKWCQAIGEVVEKNGKVVKARGTLQDITKRKQAEEKLTKTTHNLLEAQKLAHVGSWDWILGTDEVLWSNEVYHIFGLDPEHFQPRIDSVMNRFHPDDREKHEELIKKSLANKESYSFETRILLPNGSVRNVVSTAQGRYGNEEKLIRILGTVHDITDLKQAEEDKRKALKFAAEQSRYALIGQVAGKMAHDFNNVLMGIMGNAQLAIMNCDDEKIKLMLENINEFSLRGRDITSNLMSYSKDQDPKQSNFRIEDKIELVLNMLEKDLSGIKVSRNYNPEISELLADPGMIQDALANIIQNSIHAMSKVENPTLSLKAYSQDDKVYVEIEDNGCGIPKEHLDSIYTPSFTLKGSHDETGSYKSEIKGTGYGMSNVERYIVEKHKGDISLESEVGQGTKITVALRIIKDHLSLDEKKEIVKSQIYPKRRILLVEDESAIADVQYQLLTKEPFSHIVSTAANGQMAIDTFDRNKFDIVSLDYMLPGNINGLDVYNHIRENDKDIPVMFISGNIEFLESMKKLKQKDPKLEYLSKPIDNLDYVNKINELIGSNI